VGIATPSWTWRKRTSSTETVIRLEAVSCPQEPVPAGWRVWRGPVPTELGQFAVDVLGRVSQFPYGELADVVLYHGAQAAAFKSHHTWTYRGGKLVTGICIPGIALVVPVGSPIGVGSHPLGLAASSSDAVDLSTPDPSLAVYSAPPEQTDWRLVAASGAAIVATVAAFWMAMHMAGRAARGSVR
jgi:hypothetical protein